MTIKLKIDSREEWLRLYAELHAAGLLSNVTVMDVALPSEAFPLELPISTDGLTKLLSNPMVKPFKKKIDESLSKNVKNLKSLA